MMLFAWCMTSATQVLLNIALKSTRLAYFKNVYLMFFVETDAFIFCSGFFDE